MKQIHDFFCGPAAAAMIIKALSVRPPAGVVTDIDWQNRLWADIKNITEGPARPPDTEGSAGYLDEFERQQCFFCDNEWFCWAATPQALNALLNLYLPPRMRVHLHRSGDIIPDAFIASLMRSIDAGVPAAMGRGDETHWVAVHGYRVGQGRTIGGKQIHGIYVRDPQVPTDTAGTGHDLVPIDEFIRTLGFVACGSSDDQGKMISIVH